mgnify:CR=1 FL=1
MSRRGSGLDVVVVGAGVVGAAAALAFARDGLQVALVETGQPPAWARLPLVSNSTSRWAAAIEPPSPRPASRPS